MTSELVIDVQQKEISIALLEDKNLVEYQTEQRSASFLSLIHISEPTRPY